MLELVDATLDTLGHEALGLPRPDPAHISARGGSGSVTLMPPIAGALSEADDEDAEEEWLTDATLAFASDLAARVKHWTTGGLRLRNQGDRPARPEARSRAKSARGRPEWCAQGPAQPPSDARLLQNW